MSWALIWIVMSGTYGAPATGTQTFKTQALCQAAQKDFVSQKVAATTFWAVCYQNQ